MHDKDDVSSRQASEPASDARDLIGKALAARRTPIRRRCPEILIGRAELGGQIIMAPPGPHPKILFGKRALLDWIEQKRKRGFPGSPRRTAKAGRASRQPHFQRGKRRGIADIGRRVGSVDDTARPIDRRMPDQPQICCGFHSG
jgi:hypothetical protein